MIFLYISVNFLRANNKSKSSSGFVSTDVTVLVGNRSLNHRVGRRWTLAYFVDNLVRDISIVLSTPWWWVGEVRVLHMYFWAEVHT